MTTYRMDGMKAKPKARPRAGRGVMFLPRDYTEWKTEFRVALAAFLPVPTLAPVSIVIELHGPNKPRGDLDNLAGGILDAIQPPRAKGDVRAQRKLEAAFSIAERMAAAPGCLIGDDAQVVRLAIAWVKTKQRAVVLTLEEVKAA